VWHGNINMIDAVRHETHDFNGGKQLGIDRSNVKQTVHKSKQKTLAKWKVQGYQAGHTGGQVCTLKVQGALGCTPDAHSLPPAAAPQLQLGRSLPSSRLGRGVLALGLRLHPLLPALASLGHRLQQVGKHELPEADHLLLAQRFAGGGVGRLTLELQREWATAADGAVKVKCVAVSTVKLECAAAGTVKVKCVAVSTVKLECAAAGTVKVKCVAVSTVKLECAAACTVKVKCVAVSTLKVECAAAGTP